MKRAHLLAAVLALCCLAGAGQTRMHRRQRACPRRARRRRKLPRRPKGRNGPPGSPFAQTGAKSSTSSAESAAAQGLCAQLPLTVEVEDFSTNEKIFYPPQELEVADAPLAEGGRGVLAYYAPWGDVVLFYGPFDGSGQLYELGQAVSRGKGTSRP